MRTENRRPLLFAILALILLTLRPTVAATVDPGPPLPDSWIDPGTGHQVIRLLRIDRRGSSSFYFHQNAFTAAGDKIVLHLDNPKEGLDLETVDIDKNGQFLPDTATKIANPGHIIGSAVVSRHGRNIYYATKDGIFATGIDTHATRLIATFPADWDQGAQSLQLVSVNCNDTTLVGTENSGAQAIFDSTTGTRQDKINATYNAHLPGQLFTVDIKTGKLTVIHKIDTWLDHVQFSPTDPNQIMFAHEGPWKSVERIWLIKTNGSGLLDFTPHKSATDSCGHEFWDPSGKIVWFDYSDGANKSVVGKNIATNQETVYKITPGQYSRHYNISHNGKLFAGDGNDGRDNAKEILLLTPQPDGTFLTTPLCDMQHNDYERREPNVMFSPDDKWVIFSSTAGGRTDAYAVSVDKAGN